MEHKEEAGDVQFTRELGRALTCLFRGRRRFMDEKLREHEFTGIMYMILLYVDRHPGTSQDSVAAHLYLDKCSVARRAKRLEELGFLYRETDQLDRRQNKLTLTDKGQALAPVIREYLSQWGSQVTVELTDEEKAELIRLLMKMMPERKQ